MRKNFLKILFITALVIQIFPMQAEAAYLDDGYLLTASSSTAAPGATTGLAHFSGIVYPTVPGDDPSVMNIFYKSQRLGGNYPIIDHPVFTSNAQGNFSVSLIGLECGVTHKFKLFQGPADLIRVDTIGGSGQLYDAFSMPVTCSVGPGDSEDIPTSGQADTISAINWGTISVTDTSISIIGAQVTPIIYGAPVGVKIEYGKGVPDANNEPMNDTFEGFSSVIYASAPDYVLPTITINAVMPNTEYYLNMWEVYNNSEGLVEGNLYTYEYLLTNQLMGGDGLNYTFPSPTSVNIYGNILGGNGQPLNGLPIDIEIHAANDENSPIVDSISTYTSGNDLINGNAFYQHTFTGLAPETTYYVLLRQSMSGVTLTSLIAFTTPADGGGTATTTPASAPVYNGLVACAGVDCNFDKFIDTINRVINFLIVYIAFPVVAIVIAWAGIKLLISGGNPSAKTEAKAMIGKVVLGLIIALLCWVIIKLILVTLGYQGPLLGIFGIS